MSPGVIHYHADGSVDMHGFFDIETFTTGARPAIVGGQYMEIIRGKLKAWRIKPAKTKVVNAEQEIVEESRIQVVVEILTTASAVAALAEISKKDEAVDFGFAPVQSKLKLAAGDDEGGSA